MAGVGTVCFLVASAIVWRGDALTILACGWLAGLIALSRRGEGLRYGVQAVVVAALIAVKWVLVDGLARAGLFDHWSGAVVSGAPVFNTFALAGLVLGGLVWWLGRQGVGEVKQVAVVGLAVIGFAWLNFETLRLVDWSGAFADVGKAKQVALSLLWGAVGLGSVIVGFARHLRPLRYAALGLLGLTLLKIMLVDMAQVHAVYRILSFVAVGVVLLCVSYVYHRQIGEK